ncbi:MAG: hypothetical protein WCJ81_01070 [bacterium]
MTPMQAFAAKYIALLIEKQVGIHADVKVLSDGEVDLQVEEYDK